MNIFEFTRLIILALPLGIFITSELFVLVAMIIRHVKIKRNIKYIFNFYCISSIFSSFLFLTYYYFPSIFETFDIVYGVSTMLSIICFHHILCFTTCRERPFKLKHYGLVLIVYAGMLACKLIYPELWMTEGVKAMLIISALFSILHFIISFLKIHHYHLQLAVQMNTTDTIDKSKVFPYITVIFLLPWIFIICPLIMGQNPGILHSLILMTSILFALKLNIPLTYTIIQHYSNPSNETCLMAFYKEQKNSTNINSTKSEKTIEHEKTKKVSLRKASINSKFDLDLKPKIVGKEPFVKKRIYRKYSSKHRSSGNLIEIDKKKFERYFQKQKPYLNPKLTIVDLIEPLQNNRTYISKFINLTYKMNFSRYINTWRLKEMERLTALRANKNISLSKLCQKAGFSSYRNYVRAKQMSENDKKQSKNMN